MFRRLQLNASKTELIWFGSRYSLKKLTEDDLTLRLGSSIIRPDSVVRDLVREVHLGLTNHPLRILLFLKTSYWH